MDEFWGIVVFGLAMYFIGALVESKLKAFQHKEKTTTSRLVGEGKS